MARFPGSLMAGMQQLAAEGDTIGVVLIDEQSDDGGGSHPETDAQRKLLLFASRMNYPVWIVELDRSRGTRPRQPTLKTLRALLPPEVVRQDRIITKTGWNAFAGTDLQDLLQAKNVTAFAVAGYAADCCVRQTAVGGYPGSKKTEAAFQRGATQLGYLVLSCTQILRGPPATWQNERNVRFYDFL